MSKADEGYPVDTDMQRDTPLDKTLVSKYFIYFSHII